MDEFTPKMSPKDRVAFNASAAADVDHDAWVHAKIEAALEEAVDHPDKRTSLDAVWKRFGLEH